MLFSEMYLSKVGTCLIHWMRLIYSLMVSTYLHTFDNLILFLFVTKETSIESKI